MPARTAPARHEADPAERDPIASRRLDTEALLPEHFVDALGKFTFRQRSGRHSPHAQQPGLMPGGHDVRKNLWSCVVQLLVKYSMRISD